MSNPATLRIRVRKNADGSAVLACTRADGSVTWQRQEGSRGQFFPRHDLTHFAVETTLGHRRGFYGLVAEGWNITDFGTPWPRGPIPMDADPSELIAGLLDAERAAGVRASAADFNDGIATYYREHCPGAPAPTLTDDDLARIRQQRAALFAAWDAVQPGRALELTFDVGAAAR